LINPQRKLTKNLYFTLNRAVLVYKCRISDDRRIYDIRNKNSSLYSAIADWMYKFITTIQCRFKNRRHLRRRHPRLSRETQI